MTGEMVCSTPILCTGGAEIKSAVDGITLVAITDRIMVVPIPNSNNQFYVFKIDITA